MAYEMFERTATRVDTPSLAIAPGGRVALNAAACRILIDAGVRTVVILWDKARGRIAIKPTPKGEKNSFTVSFTGHHSGSFRAQSFLRHIGWNAPKRVPLATAWNAAEKMFEASLPPQYVASGSTTRKRAPL
jgi:hypothetical protein